MELTVARKDLLRLVTRMQGVAERKTPLPILTNVLLVVDGPSTLRLAATDLNLALSARMAAVVLKPGSVAVPAKDLAERVKMMPEGPVHIATLDNSMTTLKASGSARRFTLRGVQGEDFPQLPTPLEGTPTVALDVDVLQELIAKTHFSISPDETRAHLNSALFEWEGEVVRMVTTDGHRLSKMEVSVPGRQGSDRMLIPLKGIHELRRLCDDVLAEGKNDAKPQIQITQAGPSAFFQGAGISLSVKLVDAQFPPYGQVIPRMNEKQVRIPRGPFAEALRAVSIAASERTGGVKLTFAPGALRITTESPETGEGFDELSVDYDGPTVVIGFNAKYFLDVLGAISEDEIILQLSRELDPAVVRPASERQYLSVIMPMRI
jgi:DNA polymerase-3 subunit beta